MKSEKERKEYLEFVELFRLHIELMTEDWGAKVTFLQAGEKNDESEDLLLVELPGSTGTHIQRFHLEEIYHDFREHEDMTELLVEAYDLLRRCREIGEHSPLGDLEDYEKIKKCLIIRPINYDKNAERLKTGVYELIGDIALTLYVSIGNYEGLYTSSMVPSSVFKIWEKSEASVLEAAKRNTYELFPPRLFNWLSLARFGRESYGEFMETDRPVQLEGGPCGIFVTTKNQCNGAAAVFLPGVARRLGELLENDYYIAFTSMHEAAIHNCSKIYPESIFESLRSVNREVPSEEDFLSEKVYLYDRAKDTIQVAYERK